MAQVTDRTYLFLLEAVRKRPQDSARHHAVVHPISPAAGRDGGLPSGGHLFPPAGHLLELHQSNVSQHSCLFSFRFSAPHPFRVIIFYHAGHRDSGVSRTNSDGLEMPRSMLSLRAGSCMSNRVFVGGYRARVCSLFHRKNGGTHGKALKIYTQELQRHCSGA